MGSTRFTATVVPRYSACKTCASSSKHCHLKVEKLTNSDKFYSAMNWRQKYLAKGPASQNNRRRIKTQFWKSYLIQCPSSKSKDQSQTFSSKKYYHPERIRFPPLNQNISIDRSKQQKHCGEHTRRNKGLHSNAFATCILSLRTVVNCQVAAKGVMTTRV